MEVDNGGGEIKWALPQHHCQKLDTTNFVSYVEQSTTNGITDISMIFCDNHNRNITIFYYIFYHVISIL